ncbi:MAG: tetratricopeptide repeat protein [Leptolyngbyaceae bacterium]|nr:tetratricopeptide repeat protein [Leptolyngbyaceae bacterium]
MVDSLRDRYLTFIDQTITDTLKGKFRSKQQVYKALASQLAMGTSEMFERCLLETTDILEQQSQQETDELKQAKLTRKLRAIKTLQGAWEDWQKQHQAKSASTSAVRQILQAEPTERLTVFIQVVDINRGNTFNRAHLQQLATELVTVAQQPSPELAEDLAQELQEFAQGINQGIRAYLELEDHLISWLYESQRQIGFGAATERPGPWKTWAKHSTSTLAKVLFAAQAQGQSAQVLVEQCPQVTVAQWVELTILLQGLQRGLVAWFDAQPYNLQAGQNLAGMTFWSFIVLWGELSAVCGQATAWGEGHGHRLARLCFAITLQVLRCFAQRDNFPLYGGVLTAFSKEGFQAAMAYLDQPLQAVSQIQEKARILTVLGYSQQWLSQFQKAMSLHMEALSLAQEVGDRYCEVANLNHLARLALHQADYSHAINLAQRGLIVARNSGDRQGEAIALATVGYGEVMQIRRQEAVTSEQLELPLNYLNRGKTLAEKLKDLSSLAFCHVGLGAAYLALQEFQPAQASLETALPMIQQLGDGDLRAISYHFLGEIYYQLQQMEAAVITTCLAMYWLYERGNVAWQQAAALTTILQGQLGAEQWTKILQTHRSKLLSQIGQDGIDFLPQLITQYRSP